MARYSEQKINVALPCLVFGDVHGNMQALSKVLSQAGSYESSVFLGDAIAHGPQPEECVRTLVELGSFAVIGNHDGEVVSGLSDPSHAEQSCSPDWNRARLSKESLSWLGGLPRSFTCIIRDTSYRFHHGDHLSERIRPSSAPSLFAQTLDMFREDVVVIGHGHVPLRVDQEGRTLISPGAVGLDTAYHHGVGCWAMIAPDGISLHECAWR